MEWINDIIVAECITVGVGDDVTNLGAVCGCGYIRSHSSLWLVCHPALHAPHTAPY